MPETIEHLLKTCTYSANIWSSLGIQAQTIKDILNPDVSDSEFEIRCAFIESLVFRKLQLSPERLIENIMNRYAKGHSNKVRVTEFAINKVRNYEQNMTWH
jgi:hypothetical protein